MTATVARTRFVELEDRLFRAPMRPISADAHEDIDDVGPSHSLPVGLRHSDVVVVAYKEAEIDAAIARLRSDGHALVGLDCESRPTFVKGQARHPIALVQVSVPGLSVLAHVASAQALGGQLSALLTDPLVTKVGCGIRDDADFLREDFGAEVAGCVDLKRVAKRLGYPRPGLAGLSAAFGYHLQKSKVKTSNWSRAPLAPDQIRYAALDSAASLWLALRLHHHHCARGGSVPAAALRRRQADAAGDVIGGSGSGGNPHAAGTAPSELRLCEAELAAERARVLRVERACADWLRAQQQLGMRGAPAVLAPGPPHPPKSRASGRVYVRTER